MLAILLALCSAIGYGSSDFAAGLAARRSSVLQVTLAGDIVSVAVVGVGVAVTSAGPPALAAVAWGVAAGLGGVFGALALYVGFRDAAFSIAGPVSAVGAAGFSVLAGVALGEQPSALAVAGIILALPAIAGVSVSARAAEGQARRGGLPAGVAAGLAAGAGFALLFVGLERAGSGSGLWPVFCGQCTGLVIAAGAAAVAGGLRLPRTRGTALAVIAGLTGSLSTVAYFLAVQRGLLAVTAVIASLYPAVTIVAARVLAGERLTVVRAAGLCLAAVAVALIAAGG